ncbi:MAG: NADP-dependent phosphogluconate dehydrogenase, partial [Actinobacteria bacterium]|nr:NADP-dependent phosphogluconate dehydrogenase [Actinomycetota bacterium]
HYANTRRREQELRGPGLHFVGSGVSGGEQGALNGPSIMPGGSAESYDKLGPIFESIAAKVDGTPCCVHVGPDGAGHFVKMVHNGIEYADMQLIGEAYDLLRRGLDAAPTQLADIFRSWNDGPLDSFLIEITVDVLSRIDPTTDRAFVDVVRDEAEQKGTGRWTVQAALDLGVPISAIAEAVFARSSSGAVEQRAAVRGKLAGPGGDMGVADRDAFVESVRQALYAAKVVAYAQGLDLIRGGSREYDWNIDLGDMAMIWRGGCIIRAALLDQIRAAYAADADLPSLLLADPFRANLAAAQSSWRGVVARAVRAGIPVPAFSATLAYYDTMRAERLPAALIQGLRDLFGAHTYRRVDREGTFHVLWAEDGAEVGMD